MSNKMFLKNLVKKLGDDNIHYASEGTSSAESSGHIDTGCYIFNAALSGDIYGGAFDNKITAIAGPESTGKTFFVLAILKAWQTQNPTGMCCYFDTESAVTKKMLEDRGIDVERVLILEPCTVEEFRTLAVNILDEYHDSNDDTPLFFILDSMGQLSTNNEISNVSSGDNKADMGKRASLLKAAFRVLNLRLSRSKVPMFVTNHVYESPGSFIPTTTMGGGTGLKYASSQIALLSKAKDKDGTDVIGNIITITMSKNRFARENSKVKVKLSYDHGLDPYYGLHQLAIECGVWTKGAKQIETTVGKAYEKAIFKEPEKYFTEEVMEKVAIHAKKKFSYGSDVGDWEYEETTEE